MWALYSFDFCQIEEGSSVKDRDPAENLGQVCDMLGYHLFTVVKKKKTQVVFGERLRASPYDVSYI